MGVRGGGEAVGDDSVVDSSEVPGGGVAAGIGGVEDEVAGVSPSSAATRAWRVGSGTTLK